MQKEKLSTSELGLLVVGFILGGLAVTSPVKAAYQSAWLAQILNILLGLAIATIYIYIAKLNKGDNLIQILRGSFGRHLGSGIAILYIIYFIHQASITARIFGEYMVSVNYPKTPTVTIIIIMFLPIVYALKKGILVAARVNQLILPAIIGTILITVAASIPEFKPNHLLPILEGGLGHVLKIGLRAFSLSFGNVVVFLMIYPMVKNKNHIGKTTHMAILTVGLIFLAIVLRNLLVLGPHMMALQLFPPHVAISLIPWAVLEPLISVNVFAGVGIKIVIFIYCVAKGICDIFNIKDYRFMVFPLTMIIIPSSIWLYPNYPALYRWLERNMVYYGLPFQLIIPGIILIISLVKSRPGKKTAS